MTKSLEQLEKKGALSVLLFLYSRSDRAWMITELLANIACSQRALYSAIKRLHDLHLVQEIRKPEFNRRYISLTEKGKVVTRKLQDVAKILEES